MHFPSWSIQRIKRKRNDFRHKPLVLVETVARKAVVVAACKRATAQGIRVGMTPTQARALNAEVEILPHKSEEDLQALRTVGRWMMRFSPVVAIEPLSSLLLDLCGLEKLFGSLETILARVDQAVTRLRLATRIAIAPTPGAAWAFATFGPERLAIVPPQRLTELLGTLPAQSLRIESSTVARLYQLGLKSIGQVMRLSRDSLTTRFGSGLLLRLDQALGNVAEPLIGLQIFSHIVAEMQFESPIESLETIWLVFQRLIAQIIRELAHRGRGARIIKATLAQAYAKPISQTIHLSRPTRNPANLFNLLRLALENIEAEEGFTGVHLEVTLSEAIADEQIPLIQHEQHIAESELIHLIECLTVRMGKTAVLTAAFAESHIPELAYRWSESKTANVTSEEPAYIRTLPRPLHLLPVPNDILTMVSPSDDREGRPISFTYQGTIHRLSTVSGPERIAGHWWDGRGKTRDYFDVQTPSGQRFWIFRVMQTGNWYLHGFFE